jgi:hypothetical protein
MDIALVWRHHPFITKRERGAITLREEKKGEQLRTEGRYGERAEDWEEEGSEGGGGS